MKCYWCGEAQSGMTFAVNGDEIVICGPCILEALLAALRFNKYGPEILEQDSATVQLVGKESVS